MNLKLGSPPAPLSSAEVTTENVYKNWRENFVRPMMIGALFLGLFGFIRALV